MLHFYSFNFEIQIFNACINKTVSLLFYRMRLFKRRCSDPSPQLVSLSPLSNDEADGNNTTVRQTRSGQASPVSKGSGTPISGSPKVHRKGKPNIRMPKWSRLKKLCFSHLFVD